MRRQHARSLGITVIVIGAGILGGAVAGHTAPATVVREGTIERVAGDGITVATTGAAPTQVKISAITFVVARQRATLETIKPGDYVGVDATRGPDGTLVAVAIHIFPPEYKDRVRMGQFPMTSGDVMTNAQVMESVVKVENRTLFLKYQDGAAAISVPPAAEVQRQTLIRLGDLHPGMHVVVRGAANPDGSIAASSISVDRP
jgi:hypothetical protein